MIKGRLLKRKYDLEERTAVFAESIVVLVRQIKADHVNKSIISQLVRSAGSIGANYKEATEAESKKDFIPQSKYFKERNQRDSTLAKIGTAKAKTSPLDH
jgi:four helix bundle protein